jgi:hypothetical protein
MSEGEVIPMARARKRKPKTRVSDGNAYPWPCVVLAIDTASRSGWAIRDCGKLVWSGECDTLDPDELDHVVQLANRRRSIPCVLVLEKPYPRRFQAMNEGLGAARERWLAAWQRAGQRRDKRVVKVQPVSWRSRVLGSASVRMKRDEVRAFELTAARMEVGPRIPVGPDEAPAILISRWACRAPEVGACLTTRERAVRHG